MSPPVHKRPRKAVMRVAMLDASVTGRSGVLLDRARSYLTGDEVFEELYAHAVDLEEKIDEIGEERSHDTERADEEKEAKDDLRREVDSVIDDLKLKANDADAVRKRFSTVLDDEAIPKLEASIATLVERSVDRGVDEDGSLEASLRAVLDHLKALSNDVDDIPKLDEQIDTLKEAHKAAE